MFMKKPFRKRRLIPPLLGAFLAASAVGWGALVPAVGRAQDCGRCTSGSCGCGPAFLHCPPPLVHCTERPPRIKFKCVCPRPVCVPCDAEFWGYYPTCWRRWPAPYANCPDCNPPWVAVAPPGPNGPPPSRPGATLDGAAPAPGERPPQEAPAPEKTPGAAPTPPMKPPAPQSRLPYPTVPAGPPRASTSLPSQPDPLLLPGAGQETTR